jgi:hypothetical protein
MEFELDPNIVSRFEGMMWGDFFQSGGPAMYPISFFGFFMVLAACLYLLRLEARFVPVVVTTGCLTVASGFLGAASGLMYLFRYVQFVDPADALEVITLGCAEAVTNIILALILFNLAGLAMLGGVMRRALRPEA